MVLAMIRHHLYLINDNLDLVMLMHQLVYRDTIDRMKKSIQYQQGKEVDQAKAVMQDIMLVVHQNMNNHCRMSNILLPCPFFFYLDRLLLDLNLCAYILMHHFCVFCKSRFDAFALALCFIQCLINSSR
jgi:hypothetical protein